MYQILYLLVRFSVIIEHFESKCPALWGLFPVSCSHGGVISSTNLKDYKQIKFHSIRVFSFSFNSFKRLTGMILLGNFIVQVKILNK